MNAGQAQQTAVEPAQRFICVVDGENAQTMFNHCDHARGSTGDSQGVYISTMPGMGAGLFAKQDFAAGDIVCRETPLLCYDLCAERDPVAARVRAFLAPHRSLSQGGSWGDDCPGSLPYAFQWTLFLVHVSRREEKERASIEKAFYAPTIGDGVEGVRLSKTFSEASQFADFLLMLMSSSFSVFMDLPELAEFSDWPSKRISRLFLLYTCNTHQYQGKAAMFVLLSKINHVCEVQGDQGSSGASVPPGANTRYESCALKGQGVHVAKRAIAAGEQIMSNYLEGICFMSKRERRAKLLDQKLFWCRCDTCRAPCKERAFACPATVTSGNNTKAGSDEDLCQVMETCGGKCVPCTAEEDGGDAGVEWACDKCSAVLAEEQLMQALFGRYARIHDLRVDKASPMSETSRWLAVEDGWIKTSHSKTHWSLDHVRRHASQAAHELGPYHPAVKRLQLFVQLGEAQEQKSAPMHSSTLCGSSYRHLCEEVD